MNTVPTGSGSGSGSATLTSIQQGYFCPYLSQPGKYLWGSIIRRYGKVAEIRIRTKTYETKGRSNHC
jgi:hypothetical protein